MKFIREYLCLTIMIMFTSIIVACFVGCDQTNVEIFSIAEGITDAENIFLTDSGRLFMTGGTHIYEYTKDDGVQIVFEDSAAYHMGIAQIENYVYVISLVTKEKVDFAFDSAKYGDEKFMRLFLEYFTNAITRKTLLRADLNLSPLQFETVYTFQDTVIPNGMAADQDGNLYVADLSYLPVGGITKLTLSSDDASPNIVEKKWLTPAQDALAANGIVIRDQTLFFTDMDLFGLKSYVKKVDIIDGMPGPVETITEIPSFVDDFALCNFKGTEGLVVADLIRSRLVFVDINAKTKFPIAQRSTLEMPSAVACSCGMFDDDVILVTEKGNIFDPDSDVGNALVGLKVK